MKKLFLLPLLCTNLFVVAQNCTQLKKENDSLRAILGLLNAYKKDTLQSIEFSYLKATGDIKKQQAKVEIVLKNVSTIHQKIYVENFSVTDENLNTYGNLDAILGSENYFGYKQLLSGSPQKFIVTIKKVAPSTLVYAKEVVINFRLDTDYYKIYTIKVSGDKILWK